MRNEKLDDFIKTHKYMDLIYSIDRPHKVLKGNRPIEVYCEDIIIDEHKTWFWLFNNKYYVGNPITFPCKVTEDDKFKIAKDMIEELLSKSDFRDLNMELEGNVPCEEFKGKYSKCKECNLYKYGKGKNSEEACLGEIYSIPSHMNFWDIEKKWNKIYGWNSDKHKKYIKEQMIGYMNSFMWICGDREDLMKEVLEYGKGHPANKHKELFK